VIYEQKGLSFPGLARFFLTILTVLLAMACVRTAFAEEGEPSDQAAARPTDCHEQVWNSAQKLQPWWYRGNNVVARSRRAKLLSDFTAATCVETTARAFPSLIAVALAFRESSIMPHVGRGKKLGALGERGYWQVMPGGKAESFVPRDCSQHVVECNAKSAMSYMAWLRDDYCADKNGQSPWIYVGAYGRGHCPRSLEEARTWDEVKIARRIYCSIEPNCNETWPE
jgi:hypothetical protein